MRRKRSAKIIATLGPASSTQEVIEKLFVAGVDAFRLNFSHGTHEEHQARYEMIRNVEKQLGQPISVIMDLQGPKLRIGTFQEGGVILQEGQTFSLDNQATPGDKTRVFLPHPEIFKAIKVGDSLLIDDGKIHLRLCQVTPTRLETTVITGGPISAHKGLNVPSTALEISAMTTKDRGDLAFGLSLGVDWVALSFVQHPKDILEARELIGDKAGIISKLEKPKAIDHLEEIVDLSDAIMVARGDLGVEVPPEEVPSLQKKIIRCCRQAGKPVVVATQMLDSMVKSPSPTRAEASDVATAVYDGADAVMLSAESASGAYPLEAVTIMDKIIAYVEKDPFYKTLQNTVLPPLGITSSAAITAAARQVTQTLHAAAIVTFTTTGTTTLKMARERPSSPILALTPSLQTARKLALVWGVHAVKSRDVSNFTDVVEDACLFARTTGLAKDKEKIVVTAGIPFQVAGSTNILRIAQVGEESA